MTKNPAHPALRLRLRPATLALLALVPLVSLVPPAMARAQEPAPPADAPYFEVLDVQVVNVEVFVTDRRGQPVAGLSREDFAILEDGKPVAITNFYAVHDVGPGTGSGADGQETEAAAAPPPVPREQRLNLVLFLDQLSLQASSRNQLLASLARLVTELRSGDRVGVVAYDGTAKGLLEPSDDPETLRGALERASRMTAGGSRILAERATALRAIDQAPLPGEFGALARDTSAEEARAAYDGILLLGEQRLAETRRVTAALSQSIAALGGTLGRKVLVYVGEGFSERPIEALVQAWETKFGALAQQFGILTGPLDAASRSTTRLIDDLVEQANANLVTLYTVGPAGGGVSAEEGVSDSSGLAGARLWGPETAAVEAFNRSAPLRRLAAETGGRAAVDGPNPAALFDWLDQDLRAYYSLGYAPPHAADGKPHKIEVRVRDRALRLRHRTRYVAKTSDQRMRDRTLSALLFGADENPLDVAVDFGAEAPDERGRVKVEMTVRFPMANVFLVPGERHHEGRLSIFIGSRGEDGGVSDIQKVVVPVRVPNDRLLTALGQSAAYRATLVMRRGPHQVAAGVRDELGNVEAAVRVLHTPGAAARPTG